MTEFYNGRARRHSSSRPRSFCARCGNEVDDTRVSPGRGSWADNKRGLSLEIDGREGREVRRRNSSVGKTNGKQRGSPLHCYIIPSNNGTEVAGKQTSTYRESFRSPNRGQPGSRQIRSVPTSPVSVSALSPWSSASSSSFSPVLPQSGLQSSLSDRQTSLTRPPSRSRGRENSLDRTNTTYKDHFTWLS